MRAWRQALADSGVLGLLGRFDPRIAGTLPLGISLPGSDIDILCHAPDPDEVAGCLWEARERLQGLVLWRWISADRPLVATFDVSGWPAEVFASAVEVERQAGWRHFVVERRLLELGGEALRRRVLELRRAGARTEPAFAAALGLQGDPYAALYRLSQAPNAELREMSIAAGFHPVQKSPAGLSVPQGLVRRSGDGSLEQGDGHARDGAGEGDRGQREGLRALAGNGGVDGSHGQVQRGDAEGRHPARR